MNLFSAFGRGPKGEPTPPRDLGDQLPPVNSFVEVGVAGSSRRESVPVNEVGAGGIVTRCPRGMTAGATADFLYANNAGRFRFTTTCTAVDAGTASFNLPESIKVLKSFGARASARVSKVVPVQWRYAPDGAGYGDYLLGSMRDLSRSGASLVMDRTLKIDALVEVKFTLEPGGKTFVEVCRVVRAAKIETSAKNEAGIQFLAMDPADERLLTSYLHDLQMARRERGVV